MAKGKVFVLESRHHGSNQQLMAIAKSIFPDHSIVGQRFELRSRSKLFRFFCSLLIRLKRRVRGIEPVSKTLSWLAVKHGYLTVTGEDVLIAKTPPFEYPAMLLAAGTSATTVFLGTPKHFGKQDFDIIVSTPSTPCRQADVDLETLPTEVPNSSSPKGGSSEMIWGLIIGGDAKGYRYDEVFFQSLCVEMKRISESLGVRWLISSSPRSPGYAEKNIMEFVKANPGFVEICALWGKGERTSLQDLIGRAQAVMVTEDSASMVSEAVNQKVRTICLRPAEVGFNSLVTPLLRSLEAKQRVLRVNIHQLAVMDARDIAGFEFHPLPESWIDSWLSQNRSVAHKN